MLKSFCMIDPVQAPRSLVINKRLIKKHQVINLPTLSFLSQICHKTMGLNNALPQNKLVNFNT